MDLKSVLSKVLRPEEMDSTQQALLQSLAPLLPDELPDSLVEEILQAVAAELGMKLVYDGESGEEEPGGAGGSTNGGDAPPAWYGHTQHSPQV